MMFKILILQAWYNLSDEALEKQRLSNTNLIKMGVNSGSPEEKGKAVITVW
jgi:hypothetical protein